MTHINIQIATCMDALEDVILKKYKLQYKFHKANDSLLITEHLLTKELNRLTCIVAGILTEKSELK